LLQLEVAEIFQDDRRHRHAKSGGKILHCHLPLPFRVGQELNEAACQIERIPRLVELNGQFFSVGHLTKIGKVGTDNRHTVCAGQMGNTARAGRRRIGHDRDRGTLEKFRQAIFMHVSRELNCRIAGALRLHRFNVARSLRMVSAGDDQLGIRQYVADGLKRIDHQFEALVGPPLAEGKYAMLRATAPGKVGILRSTGKNSVRPDVNIVAAIFLGENSPIAGHQY
jgi:hypothetical protein